MSKSETVVIESIEVQELLRFLFYIDILNKLLLLLCMHSKYMYARCLNFPCFIKFFGCILACILHVLCVRLTRENKWLKTRYQICFILEFSTLRNTVFTGRQNVDSRNFSMTYHAMDY